MIRDNVKIDPELEKAVPPVRFDYYEELKENLRRYGYDLSLGGIVLWQPDPNKEEFYIADGHHRWKACGDLHINLADECFTVRDFADKHEVIQWMQRNAISQRNMTQYQQYQMGKRYWDWLLEQEKSGSVDLPKGDKRKLAAMSCGLSEGVFSQYIRVMKSPYEDLKENLRNGLTTPYRADEVRKKRMWDDNQDKLIAKQKENGTHYNVRSRKLDRKLASFDSYLEKRLWELHSNQRGLIDYLQKHDYPLVFKDLSDGVTRIYFECDNFGRVDLFYGKIMTEAPQFDMVHAINKNYMGQILPEWKKRYERNLENATPDTIRDLPEAFLANMLQVLEGMYNPEKAGKKFSRKIKLPEFYPYVQLMRQMLGM